MNWAQGNQTQVECNDSYQESRVDLVAKYINYKQITSCTLTKWLTDYALANPVVFYASHLFSLTCHVTIHVGWSSQKFL